MSYREQLFALQPPGPALPYDPESVWGRLLDGLAQEFERVELRAHALVRESDPRQSVELLPDWERVCGLPGDCPISWDSTLQARRAAVVAQLTGAGGQRIAYFSGLARLLGLGITVTEYRPFLAGLSRCGDRLNGDHDVRFVWSVVVQGQRMTRFRCGASVPGERLLDFARREDLECLLRLYAPAHTILIIGYEE
ncbi:putative phage tail protein [uncultured Desulfovibrio sp.]|uniref:YmfQ family protein n=1 Tax=uncultured Desulfovibrio sp. TaxID=167968 RepID=UPI0003A1B2F8|nr:putative phage tail protein [uncultured Desulfovibrio sp.]